jgi:GT2 family glycosyltransferase
MGSRVSAIVVSYNTRELLRRCLSSLGGLHEVIVVDNASLDGSADMVSVEFPRVRLIRNDANRGFGAANNQGLAAMTGDLALLLNSDAAAADHDAVERLARLFDDPGVVAAGGALLNADGSPQPSAAGKLTLWAVFCEQTYIEKLFPRSALFSPYWKRSDRRIEVEQVMGACLMMRPLERFDESFFLYCEDTELCERLRKHGRILYEPAARFWHALGASSDGARWKAVARYNAGKERFFLLHRGRAQAVLVFAMNRLGAALRMTAWLIVACLLLFASPRARRQVALFARVLFAPLRGW